MGGSASEEPRIPVMAIGSGFPRLIVLPGVLMGGSASEEPREPGDG